MLNRTEPYAPEGGAYLPDREPFIVPVEPERTAEYEDDYGADEPEQQHSDHRRWRRALRPGPGQWTWDSGFTEVGGVGILIHRSDRVAVYVISMSLHPQVFLSDCRESCFCRQPSLQQSVDIYAFPVQMVTTQAVHGENTPMVGWGSQASWLPTLGSRTEQLSIKKGPLSFLELICSSIAPHFQSSRS